MKMEWTIETTRGCFEGSRLKKVIESMVQHYGENDQDPAQITSITAYYENSKERQICQKGIGKIQDKIEEDVADWRKESQQAYEGQKDIERDYWASSL